MLESIPIEEFIQKKELLFDVRSPCEFTQGTIPGALNLPLFSDQERKIVGTLYKEKGHKEAFLQGLEFIGSKLSNLVKEGLKSSALRLFCSRGGQRSGSMGWLMSSAGIPSITLQGGYKSFRKYVNQIFSYQYNFHVIGGLTGSGKTALLQKMQGEGKQVIDLEALAGHRGSAFGMLGKENQPSTESFENHLAYSLSLFDSKEPIWIEDESRMIGTCKIPDSLYIQMVKSPLHLIETSFESRLRYLVNEYGIFSKEELIYATKRLIRRLGEERTKEIIFFIQEGNLPKAATLLLSYYDAAYFYSIKKHNRKVKPL